MRDWSPERLFLRVRNETSVIGLPKLLALRTRLSLRLAALAAVTGLAAVGLAQSVPLGEAVHADPETLESLGYEPLFDGVSLEGWRNPYDHGEASVIDGEIRLTSDRKFFLVTERPFKDFRLFVDIRLPEGPANSGVMFRCHVEPNRVFGYQAECDGSDRRWSGGLYDEGRRNWIWPSVKGRSEPEFLAHESESQEHFQGEAIRNALDRDGWNRYEITCRGERIIIKVNGVTVTDRVDASDRSGYLGLQHHGEAGQVYRFRNLYVKEFPELPARGVIDLVDQAPVAMERLGSGALLVDFGRVAFGALSVTPPEGSAETLTVRFGEKLLDHQIDRNPPGTIRYAEVSADSSVDEPLRVSPTADARNAGAAFHGQAPPVMTPPEWGVVLPFRWVEIEGLPAVVAADRIVRRAAFPVDWDDAAAAFECSDETLNRVWDLCRYSIKATAFAGVYVDGDRERIPYEADAYLNQLSHYYAEGDIGIARRTIDWLIDNPTWPTEWQPHLVFMAYADWMQTGDAEWLKTRYAALKTRTLADRFGPSGFVESDEADVRRHDIVDWPPGERDGYVRSPLNTVVNAFHLAAVEQMAELAEAVGREGDAAAYRDHATRLRRVFDEVFFDAQTGRYRDGSGIEHHAQHASLFPLAFGITPPEHRNELAGWLADRGMRCSVYAAQYLLEALFENGQSEAAVELITASGDRSWRHMLDQGATITWEAWDLAYKKNLDWNHAWGAAPANLLPRYVLGVEPLTPGWKRISVHPRPSGLSYARGTVPSPNGPVLVDWKRGEAFRFELTVPAGCVAEVRVPAASPAGAVRIDGEPVAAHLHDDHWVLEQDVTGAHLIEVK